MVEIAPSILAADFARLGDAVETVKRGGARTIHVDVMDGRFVPNLTIGPPVVASLRQATDLFLDCHLMIVEPERLTAAFAQAGAQRITVHQEACPHLHRNLQLIHAEGIEAGVALNPATPSAALDEVLDEIDLALVMSVNPGFGGQRFLDLAYAKIRGLAERRRARGLSFRIQVDGGVTVENAAALAEAGCDSLVAGSSIFATSDPSEAVKLLEESAARAGQRLV
jgi:ribulose-phosphate 3-epimerase